MPLLERDLELGTASDWLDRVQAGRGGRLLVEGPAGIGKSVVLEALAERAKAIGMVCLVTQGSEVASHVAFGAARSALGAGWPETRAPLEAEPESGRSAPNPVRDAVHVALELAEQQPLLVAIDDVQWVDAASLRWLALLAAQATNLPVGLALAARTGAGSGKALDELLDDRGAVVVRPAPLSLEAAAELIEMRLGRSVDRALVSHCHTETGGNPYLLLALADALRQAGVPDGPGARARVREVGARAVSRGVARRLDRLDPGARRLVEAVAVLGDLGGLPMLASVAELAAAQAAEAVRRLVELDLLVSAEVLEMTHPLVGAAVRAEVSVARRAELAHSASTQLRAAGRPEEAAARLADLPPQADPAVAELLSEAAEVAAARGAPDVAAMLLRRALAEPPAQATRAGMQAALGRVLLASGDPQALGVLQQAFAATPPGPAAAEIALSLAVALNYARRTSEAAEMLDRASADLGPEHAALAEELEAMTIHYLSFDPGQRVERARRLGRWGERRGASEPAYRMRLAELSTDAVIGAGPAAETVSLAERALAGGTLLSHNSAAFAKAALALAYGGKPAAARAHFQDAVVAARRRGDTVTLGFALALQGETRRLEGDMTAVESDTRTGLGLMPPGELGPRFMLRGVIESLVEQGRLEEAEQELRASELAGELPPIMPTPGLLHARALVRIATGSVALGLEDLVRAGELAERLELRDPLSVPWRLAAAEALILLDDRARADELLAEHLQLAHEKGLSEVIGPAFRVKGILTGGRAGLRVLEEAVELLEGGFARLELARALVEFGAAGWQSDRSRARAALDRGGRIARELGARTLAARATSVLAQGNGVMLETGGSNEPALSDTEQRVARLAAEGLSNREIAETLVLTERAVESELSAASRKLAARSPRVQVRPARGRDELSERELEVLRLLGTSLSMREISTELYVSQNTLKTHCKSLYRKLDVRSRDQAVARGRAAGLLRVTAG
jgi:DNA-binding NarL/FixJ family response regulator